VIGDPPSLAAFFQIWRRNPGEFLRYEGESAIRRLSYEAAARSAAEFAARLREANITKGERIILWGENRPEWIVALWGCLLEGVVAVPIDFRSSAAIAGRIAGIVTARALVIGEGLHPPEGLSCPVWPLAGIETNRALSSAPEASFAPIASDEIAEILFTSGATGDPKGVTITHRNILANLRPIDEGIEKYRKYMGPFSPIRFLNLLPLSHMFGQAMAAFIPAMIAGEVFFLAGYGPREVGQLIRRRRISVLVCVPQMLDLLRDYIMRVVPESAEPARSRKWYVNWWQFRHVHRRFGWKFWAFVVGAAPLDPALEEFWAKLGYVVIQGYGLTETAPVATLNHPFDTRRGTVGKPIAGVEIRIAPDGEVLLRGENVTPGYFRPGEGSESSVGLLDAEGWLHTGDIGELDENKRLKILGRKKEMIVSPDGLNVFPEDVERVLNTVTGVRESAAVAARSGAREHVHAVLVLDPGADPETVIAAANEHLESHQRIRTFSVWPGSTLPRTSGTGKLKRVEIASQITGGVPPATSAGDSAGLQTIEDIIRKFAGGRQIDASTQLDQLGLSSLDRIQLMMELEQRSGKAVDESQFANARTIADLTRGETARVLQPGSPARASDFDFPEWNRARPARWLRGIVLPGLILPLARVFAWIHVTGLENLRDLMPPVIFASNHQSHLDVPAIFAALPSVWRYRTAPAMSKEFFDAHFHPQRYPWHKRFTNGLNYVLACLLFNTFPLPQRESGAREALRYAGDLAADGTSILIFPEGKRTAAGEVLPFQPGVGMLASRLRLPVVPVRLEGLERVLHKDAKFPTPGRAHVKFGAPLHPEGEDYAAIAQQIETAVRNML
jgi:long-chain acyl-CoA synthetase